MNRENPLVLRVTFAQAPQNLADAQQGIAEVLTTVTSHQNEWSRHIARLRQLEGCRRIEPFMFRQRNRIYDRIAGHNNGRVVDPLAQQVLASGFSRSEVAGCNPSQQAAIGFFGKWAGEIASSKPRFDVANRDATMKCSEAGAHCSRRIPLYKYPVRFLSRESAIHLGQDACRQDVQRLPRTHRINADIRFDTEIGKRLSEHLPVLAARADDDIDVATQCRDNGRQLDHFGPRAHYDHDFHRSRPLSVTSRSSPQYSTASGSGAVAPRIDVTT